MQEGQQLQLLHARHVTPRPLPQDQQLLALATIEVVGAFRMAAGYLEDRQLLQMIAKMRIERPFEEQW